MKDIDIKLILGMLFGLSLVVVLAVLAAIIALGKVEMQTSYGLPEVIGGLLVLAGGFSNWAFHSQGPIVPPPSLKDPNTPRPPEKL